MQVFKPLMKVENGARQSVPVLLCIVPSANLDMHGLEQGKRKAVQSSTSGKQQSQEPQGCSSSEEEPLDAYRRAVRKFKDQPRRISAAGAKSISDLFQERP